MAIIHHVSS